MTTRDRLFDRIHMLPLQSIQEEIASGIIHGIGILIAIASLVLLVVFASLEHNTLQVISFSIFGGFSVFYYLCSTFHHSLTHYKAKRVFRIMEQCAVFLFMIGSVLPLTLILFNSTWGWIFFIFTALLGFAGIFNLFFNKKNSSDLSFIISFVIILFLIIASACSLKFFPANFKIYFIPGSLLYLGGLWFSFLNGLKYNQAITHSFILAGTILHFFAFLQLI